MRTGQESDRSASVPSQPSRTLPFTHVSLSKKIIPDKQHGVGDPKSPSFGHIEAFIAVFACWSSLSVYMHCKLLLPFLATLLSHSLIFDLLILIINYLVSFNYSHHVFVILDFIYLMIPLYFSFLV